jgi:DNA-binding response OmpR family regulator
MSGKRILIIEDDQFLLLALAARLKANGYSVVSGADALSAISVALKEAPDLVILDLGLPAQDGFVVLEQMRGLPDLVETPVIVLTASDPAENEKRALEGGAVAFFQKPFDNHELLTVIRQALGETIALSTFLKT